MEEDAERGRADGVIDVGVAENDQRTLSAHLEREAFERLRRFDGVYRWFLISVEPLHDEAGRIVRWYGISTDIDGRKQAEDRLRQENAALKRAEEKIREQEAEWRQMLEFTPQLVRVFGPDHERIYANRVGLDYLGVSLEEWRQTRDMCWFVHPDDGDRMRAFFDRARSIGAAFELEVRLRKADGSHRWFLVRYNPVCDNKGQVLRWYVAGTDIEDRKQAEDRLRRENVALREEIDKASMFEEIVGTSPALKSILLRISKVALTDSTVLITGETGTGKELVARAIHRRSDRASCAFVSVNCAVVILSLLSCSAMKRVPSRARLSSAWAGLSWQMEALSSSTKLENFRMGLRLPSCVFCKSMSLSVSAGHARYALTFE